MEGNKYRSFRMETEQLRKDMEQINSEGKNIGNIFKIDEKVQLFILPDDHKETDQLCVMLNDNDILLFDTTKHFFYLINHNDKLTKQIKKDKDPQWSSSLYDMFFFRETQELCIVEKNSKENKIKITHFEIETDQIREIDGHILDQNQWTSSLNIFKTNEEGLLAWCSASKDSLNLSLFSRKNGFKLLNTSENPYNADLEIISIGQSHSNCIHLCVNSPENKGNLPILVIETINGFEQIKDVRQPKQKSGKAEIKGKIDCILNIGDFFILDVVEQKNKKCQFIYSFDTESIEEQKRPFEGEYSLAKKYVGNNRYCSWRYANEGKEVIVQHTKLYTIHSLSVLKMLRSIGQIQEAAKIHKNAILIFGAHMSGKTTFRHYLAGDELEYVQNQGGFYQVQIKNDQQKKYSQLPEKGMLIQTSVTDKGVFIQIPEYNTHEQSYFKVEICTLMQQIFKNFKTLQAIITIPYEYIEDSQNNVSILASVLKMIKLGESEVSQSISIVLTKVEDEEEATQLLTERIEQIMELNEEIGTIVNKINSEQRIFTFKNEEPNRDLAEEILELILNTEQLPLQAYMASKIKQKIEAEGITDALLFVRSETSHFYDLLGKALLFFSHFLIGEPKYLNQTDFRNETKQIGDELSTFLFTIPQAPQSQKLIPILFNSLGHLKLFLQKKQERTPEKIEIIKKHLLLLADEYQILTNQGSANVFRIIVNCFIVALNLSCSSLEVQETQEQYSPFVETNKSIPYGILSKKFIPVISSLCDKALELKDSELMASLKPYMTVSAGRVIIKTKIVPMSYNQQKSYHLKQGNMLQIITSLPSNTMKLDLMMQQLIILGKEQISDNNMRIVRYYLRQCSRVCHFHKQYLQALIFLMVIPDFYGIDLLLDELVDYRKENNSYQNRLLFSEPESELIGELMVISRSCVRDSLVKKLIYIKTLHAESSNKKATVLSQEEQKVLNENLSKDGYDRYQRQLQQKTGLLFFNFKNETYKRLMDNRIKLIDKCRLEESNPSFQDIQALNWVIETTPIPA